MMIPHGFSPGHEFHNLNMKKLVSSLAGVRWKKTILIIIGVIVLVRLFYIVCMEDVDKPYYTLAEYDLAESEAGYYGTYGVKCYDIVQYFIPDRDTLLSVELLFTNVPEHKNIDTVSSEKPEADEYSDSVAFQDVIERNRSGRSDEGAICLQIYTENGELLYQTDISVNRLADYKWEYIHVNAPVTPGSVYKLVLSAADSVAYLPDIVVLQGLSETGGVTDSYINGSKTGDFPCIRYGYQMTISLKDRLVICLLWIILYILLCLILYYWESVRNPLKRLLSYFSRPGLSRTLALCACEVIAGLVILSASGIHFTDTVKIVFFIISIAASIKFPEKYENICRIAETPLKKAALFMLYLYAAFALVGERCIIHVYPDLRELNIGSICVYLCAVLWFIPVLNSIIYYLDVYGQRLFGKHIGLSNRKFAVIIALLLLIPAVYGLYVLNPGISSPDTTTCMITNAQHIVGMYDWHPAFYCMVLSVIESVWNSTYAVIIFQYAFWVYVMTEFFLYMRKKDLSDTVAFVLAGCMGLNPGNFLLIDTIWKDIPYTMSLFWTFLIIARLSLDYEEYRHRWYVYIELIIALTGVFFFRKNGVVVFAVIVCSLIIVLRKNIRLIISLLLCAGIIFLIRVPLYSHFEIQDPGNKGMYIGLSQDILGVYYANGKITEDTMKMVNAVTGNNNDEYEYYPTWSLQSYDLDVTPGEFIKGYSDTFLKNPVLMIRRILEREDAMWDIFPGENVIYEGMSTTSVQDGAYDENYEYWNDYYSPREFKPVYPTFYKTVNYTAKSQWLSAVIWRPGLWCLLALAALVLIVMRFGFKKHMLIAVPGLGHALGLILTTGWSEYRYYWPLILLNAGIIIVGMTLYKKKG